MTQGEGLAVSPISAAGGGTPARGASARRPASPFGPGGRGGSSGAGAGADSESADRPATANPSPVEAAAAEHHLRGGGGALPLAELASLSGSTVAPATSRHE